MTEWIEIDKDEAHIAREKQKARDLRRSAWWQNKLAAGICHYCGRHFPPEELTMDHVVPLSRGGKSTKGNIVPCCKACNNQKKYLTPVEMLLDQLPDRQQD
ncbi:MAG: HNH endonuclease [Deltaproteobacteria bacterium]|nr:HNH endonuclease [Candidatus Anaeroferrophillus wilburensis]MBN2888255.1 HNH endonuclease [Deltaproteobacteria bacterium]